MKKTSLIAAALLAAGFSTTRAGGFLTNTNQSAYFLRFPAMEAMFNVESAYYGPGAIGFLAPGWHLSVNNQSAFQTRTVVTTFGPYAYGNGPFYSGNGGNGISSRRYKGTASAPVLPSLDLGYVNGRWFGSFHFGVIGGGGKCEFKNGLGSFEGIVSVVPSALNGITKALGVGDILENSYGLNTYMRGRQYYFGAQIGLGYRLSDNLAVSLGGRLVYATSNYKGYVHDITLIPSASPLTAAGLLQAGQPTDVSTLVAALGAVLPESQRPALARLGSMVSSVDVNCDQTGWGFAPVVGLAYQNGALRVGARYEFKTRLRLKNNSNVTSEQAALLTNLAEFEDGRSVPGDIPALLGVGVAYDFTPRLHAAISGHYYFDKDAHQFENKQKNLNGNTWEVLAGVEYDFTDRFSASVGGQSTNYGLGKSMKYVSDLSFVTSSYSLGAGVKVKLSDKADLNLSYFKTFYYSTTKTQDDYNGTAATLTRIAGVAGQAGILDAAKTAAVAQDVQTKAAAGAFGSSERFDRTNDVIGVGVTFHF
ncbi:MAG: outer membrane beta-barrel protein [Bacteroidaceae bacterium]|nr:outer membrane beta-barrel protein [Bacteroidaceae bacterium]